MISHIINETDLNPSIFHYIPNFLNINEERALLKYLDETTDFLPSPNFTDNYSRLQKWYQTDQKYFCPLWKARFEQWKSFEIDSVIIELINKIQLFINSIQDINSTITIPKINSCLINKYPSGNHHISPHRDSPQSFGEEPTIIGLSIGDTRTIMFERAEKNFNNNFSFDLESRSIFIMAGSSQQKYLHSIKKNKSKNVRYSLTFREFIL